MVAIRQPGEECAVKFLRQLGVTRLDRFKNEIRVLRELNSSHISKFFDEGDIELAGSLDRNRRETVPWVAMQLGGPNMRRHVESIGALSVPKLQQLATGLCSAISHLHDVGYIHRDIKPDNFVWRDDKRSELVMIDFGIAKKLGEDVSARPMDTFTQINEFVGPVFFSSPELIEYSRNKAHPVDHRSDIFQAGKLVWYLATGQISAGIPSRKACPADGRLRDIVISMIDDDPDNRPQTMDEVLAALLAI
jgi:serine/threonine protein kinase